MFNNYRTIFVAIVDNFLVFTGYMHDFSQARLAYSAQSTRSLSMQLLNANKIRMPLRKTVPRGELGKSSVFDNYFVVRHYTE